MSMSERTKAELIAERQWLRTEIKRLRIRAEQAEGKLALAMKAIHALVIVNGREIGFRTLHNLPMEMAKRIEGKVRAALAAVRGEK